MTSNSANYWFTELALAKHGRVFKDLEKRMDAFVPRPLSDFEDEWRRLWDQYRPINQDKSDREMNAFVNEQIAGIYSERQQFLTQFWDEFEVQIVVITTLSHALVEATINAILAFALVNEKTPELFTLVERANVKEKWTIGPKVFLPKYTFDKSGRLYEGLNALCRTRNGYAHPKVTIRNDQQQVVLEGTESVQISLDAKGREWIGRFLRLPYQLHSHFLNQVEDQSMKFFLSHFLRGAEDLPLRALWSRADGE